jgi:hypothetical protein
VLNSFTTKQTDIANEALTQMQGVSPVAKPIAIQNLEKTLSLVNATIKELLERISFPKKLFP